jgi:hypothetical protein
MLRLVSRLAAGLHVAAFAVVCVAAAPAILFMAGVGLARESVEARWPDSRRARAASFWIGLLAPVVLCAGAAAVLWLAAARVRARQGN